MSNAYAVVMAGGAGTRFWPLSRGKHPKQLLPLGGGDESLIRATVRRVAPLIPSERVLIVTSHALVDAIARELPDVPRKNILAEPVGRNTAPCVAWAAATIARTDPSGVLVVLAADHHMADEAGYLNVVRRAVETAASGEMVTVGIKPTRAETGYGYLEVGEAIAQGVMRAKRFVEKPNAQKAEEFLRAGNYLWNSGQFFFRADVVLKSVETHLPELAKALREYDTAAGRGEEARLVETTYGTLPNISIDHGIMEKADRVAVIPGDFGWSDVGSWTTAYELAPKDSVGNAMPATAICVDATNNYIKSSGKKVVALVGVHDLVVVDTEDALLILPRDRAQDVREIVQRLKERNDTTLL